MSDLQDCIVLQITLLSIPPMPGPKLVPKAQTEPKETQKALLAELSYLISRLQDLRIRLARFAGEDDTDAA